MRQAPPSPTEAFRDPGPRSDPGVAEVDQPWAPASAVPRSDADSEASPEEVPAATLASDEEVLRAKRFDAMEPDELARVYALMTQLTVATPQRLTRRRGPARHGPRVDLRRTLRASLRTGGDPVRLARRRRRTNGGGS